MNMQDMVNGAKKVAGSKPFLITQSIIAIVIVALIVYQVVNGRNVPDAAYAILSVIIGYYFGRESVR